MDESDEILLNSLKNGGISIADDVSSIKDLTPVTLFSICAQSLNLMEGTTSFQTSLPDLMAEKFRICTEISSAIKNLGYIGDISYYKLLYPSEEDLYKLIRFLVERLSELPKGVKVEAKSVDARRQINKDNYESTLNDIERESLEDRRVGAQLEELKLKDEVPQSSSSRAEDVSVDGSIEPGLVSHGMDEVASDKVPSSNKEDLSVNEQTNISGKHSTEELENVGVSGNEKMTAAKQVSAFQQRMKAERSQDQEKDVEKATSSNSSELQQLEEEYALLKQAAEMAFDDTHSTEYYLEQLNEQVEARKKDLAESHSQWSALISSLEEKRRSLEESLYASQPEAREKLEKLREVQLDRQTVLSELREREIELAKLSADLNNQPKAASRKSYIERVKEITKNSRKQDADIERILKETRELQLESNSIRERLDRTYAVVDDMVFREAKKDPVGRQAYKLLTSIHESFEQVSEKILATDRVRREASDYEKKLSAIASRILNVDKLQADLDAIMKENEYLEKRHSN